MFEELFVKRTYFFGCQLSGKEDCSLGWAGGNAPEWFHGKEHLLLDEAGNKYSFFLTLKLPGSDKMLSIFIPERFAVYSNAAYPCGIKVFEHPYSQESQGGFYRLMPEKPEPGSRLTKYQREKDYTFR